MALSPLVRLTLTVHADEAHKALEILQDHGTVEVIDDEHTDQAPSDDSDGSGSALAEIVTVLTPHGSGKQKIRATAAEAARIYDGFDWLSVHAEATRLGAQLSAGTRERATLEQEQADLVPLEGFGLGRDDLDELRWAEIGLWALPKNRETAIRQSLDEQFPPETLSQHRLGEFDGETFLAMVTTLTATDLTPVVRELGGRQLALPSSGHAPEHALAVISNRLAALYKEEEAVRSRLTAMAEDLPTIRLLADFVTGIDWRNSVHQRLVITDRTRTLVGWILEDQVEALERDLAAITPRHALRTEPPGPDDETPVLLSNNGLIAPFEFVTTLFGHPHSREIDPTPWLAPFFALFFALCLTDAGYGFLLAAAAGIALWRLEISAAVRGFLRLLVLVGSLTIVAGVFTGGWFGLAPPTDVDAVVRLPVFLHKLAVLDPIAEPLVMLQLALALGIVHIFVGMLLRTRAEIRARRAFWGVVDSLVWMGFITALLPFGYELIIGGDVSPTLSRLAGIGIIAFPAAIVLTQGRNADGLVRSLMSGTLKLYDTVGYFGDVLSYARLLALGLATSAIALAINSVATMSWGIAVVGPVIAVLVVIGGHLFNLVINCLGAFVHAGRLQYVEFFSKFFEGGGRPFRPFSWSGSVVANQGSRESG